MAEAKTSTHDDTEVVQTTLRLQDKFLQRVKRVALDERTTTNQLCIEGLEMRLALLSGGKKELDKLVDRLSKGELARAS